MTVDAETMINDVPAGQMCFGAAIGDFHTFEASFSTLLRYPLGDFNYQELTEARPSVAPLFFVLYMGLVFLVCMNMVVAIITIAFESVTVGLKVRTHPIVIYVYM
jgi:hypothetical protein